MATVNSLLDRVRRSLADWPEQDALTGITSNVSATIPVNERGNFKLGQVLVIDQEALRVSTAPSASGAGTVAVQRAFRGTTAATHASAAGVLINPFWTPQDILDGLNEGQQALWPYFFKRGFSGTTTVTLTGQADYAAPSPFTGPGRITSLDILSGGGANDEWRRFRQFRIFRGSSGATIHFEGAAPATGTIFRVRGLVPFTTDLVAGGSTDTEMPDMAIPALLMYARAYCLSMKENARLDSTGAKNVGPAAMGVGAALSVSQTLMQQFVAYCRTNGMPWPTWQTRI